MIPTATSRGAARWLVAIVSIGSAALVAAGCSSSSKSSTAVSSNGAASSPSSPATMFSTANVTGLGTVLVDGNGRTVYVLTADGHTNAPCEDSTGCTKVWPDLPLPAGVSAAKAGTGAQAALLATMKGGDGQTYPTYKGWLMYEFTGDTGPGQGHGEGIQSFGGTWYAVAAAGDVVLPAGASPTATTAAPSGVAGY